MRQLTSYPAQVFGIRDRGRLVPGAWADLLLIDPARWDEGRRGGCAIFRPAHRA